MTKASNTVRVSCHTTNRNSLEKFIARLLPDAEFNLCDWLKTLKTVQLRRIEQDARTYCKPDGYNELGEGAVVDIVHITLTIYVAERCFEVSKDEVFDCLDSLLYGLAVAACVERLERAGWVQITNKMTIVLQDPPPYRVTRKGLEDGVWSHEPLELWLLGAHLKIH